MVINSNTSMLDVSVRFRFYQIRLSANFEGHMDMERLNNSNDRNLYGRDVDIPSAF